VYRPHLPTATWAAQPVIVPRAGALPSRPAASWQASDTLRSPRVPGRSSPISSPVLQRMQLPPEPEMRSQFSAEGKWVDLNCGRYCVESAMKWWAQNLRWNIGDDVFHQLPEPTPKSFLGLSVSWSPGNEGSAFTKAVAKPDSLDEWDEAIQANGPLIVSGKLGDAIVTWVGHYILVVGVDRGNQQLVCKDPLKGNETVRYKFDWIQPRIQTVHAVDPVKLQTLKQ